MAAAKADYTSDLLATDPSASISVYGGEEVGNNAKD